MRTQMRRTTCHHRGCGSALGTVPRASGGAGSPQASAQSPQRGARIRGKMMMRKRISAPTSGPTWYDSDGGQDDADGSETDDYSQKLGAPH